MTNETALEQAVKAYDAARYRAHGSGEDFEPTHWMPLPEPPSSNILSALESGE